MKHFYLFILLFTFLFSIGQNKDEYEKYKTIVKLQSKKDSLENAYKYYSVNLIKNQIKKVDKEINKLKIQIDINKIETDLYNTYYLGDSLFNLNKYEAACVYLNKISKLYNEKIISKKVDYLKTYTDLSEIYIQKHNLDSALYNFDRSIDFGNQNTETLIEFFSSFYPESKNFYNRILGKMNRKLIENNDDTIITTKILLRLIYLADQVPRWLSYGKSSKGLPMNFVYRADTLNQNIISYLLDNNLLPKIIDLGYDASVIDVVLLHASHTNHSFFEKYFSVYASSYNFDFIQLNSLKFLFDMYLKSTRGTQYFGTVKGRLADGSFGSLPIENTDTVKTIFTKLKIKYDFSPSKP